MLPIVLRHSLCAALATHRTAIAASQSNIDARFINKAQPLVAQLFDLAPVAGTLIVVALRDRQSFFCARA